MTVTLRITKLARDHTEGFWRARVSANGTTINVDRRYGSWQAQIGERRREVLPRVAAALQKQVRRREYRERRTASAGG
jgi:hypothetical protein